MVVTVVCDSVGSRRPVAKAMTSKPQIHSVMSLMAIWFLGKFQAPPYLYQGTLIV